MPRELMNEQQVARYLHMDLREVLKLASREQLPGRKVRGNWQFMKIEIDHWVEGQMHTLDRRRLAGIERGVSEHHGFDALTEKTTTTEGAEPARLHLRFYACYQGQPGRSGIPA